MVLQVICLRYNGRRITYDPNIFFVVILERVSA